jgi:hypothetical protein
MHHAGIQLGRLPGKEALKGMPEFDASKQVDEAEVGKAVADIISQLGDKGQHQKQSSSGVPKLVPTGPGMASLSKKLVDRIISGQYVDFAELPPAKGRMRSLPNAEEGHIVIIRAEDLAGSKKMIPDLATWLQCFCIYAAVHEPARTKSLLAYATIIAKASLKYSWPSWVVYDQNFRQEVTDSGNKDWARVDPSIYTQCFTSAAISTEGWCRFCQSVDHSSEMCPVKASQSGSGGFTSASTFSKRPGEQHSMPNRKRAAPHSVNQICKKYNQFNGDCKFGEACIYQHRCKLCDKPGHLRGRCTENKRGGV